jgi:hypothetical protein
MKIKGESTSVKVLPWDPFATFNVAVNKIMTLKLD